MRLGECQCRKHGEPAAPVPVADTLALEGEAPEARFSGHLGTRNKDRKKKFTFFNFID